MGHSVRFMTLLLCCMAASLARDLGCYGEVFSIQEASLLEVIQRKLKGMEKTDALAEHQQAIQNHMMSRIQHPKRVESLRHTTQPRTFTFDPTFMLDHDVTDDQGHVLYPRGTRINPLHQVSLTKPLLFIDGDAHGHWVKEQLKQNSDAKVILVSGAPFDVEKNLHHPVYFDQGGFLCKKLRLTQVPARVTQQGDQLLVEEVFSAEATS